MAAIIFFWVVLYQLIAGASLALGTNIQESPGLMAGAAAFTITPADGSGDNSSKCEAVRRGGSS